MGTSMKRSTFVGRSAVAAVGAIGALLVGAAPASAEPLITVNVDNIVYGSEGDLVLVGSAAVPADFVGQTCLIKAGTVNQESVHPGNDLVIVSGDQQFVVEEVEGLADQVSEKDEFDEIAPVIDVFIRLGPDGVSSGGFVVTVDCSVQPPVETTTTTEAPETTTTTGAIDPQGGSSIIDQTTTTAPPPAGPTTEQPPATVAPTSVAPPPAGPTLPVTGSSVGIFVFSGLWLIGAGFWLHQRAAFARPTR